MKHLLKIFIGAFLVLLTTNINAQVTTSGISGVVTDQQTREMLIGVNVVVTHVPTGTVYGAATNAKGVYNIQGLRPGGPYTVKASYVGYQSKVFEDVYIDLGETLNLKIWLKNDSKALEQVIVTADRNSKFNSQRTGAATSFNRRSIENTPSISRSIFDIASLTPQANSNGAGTSFAGSSNKYNSFQIDGTVSNDVFGLSGSGTNGGQTGANPISLEAIDAVQVVIAPFDVRQSGFTGGGVNAITKSGSNIVHGSLYGFYTDQNLYGTTPGKVDANKKRTKIDNQQDKTLGFTIGAPIVKDKLFLFVNGEYADNTSPLTYTVGNRSNISYSVAKQVEDKVREITGGKYNAGGFGPFVRPQKSYKALGRLDWNIAQGHRLTLRYSLLDANKTIISNSSNSLYFNDAGYIIKNKTHSIVAELNSRFNDKYTNELRFGYTRVRDTRTFLGTPFPTVKIETPERDYIYIGTESYSTANALKQDVFTLTDNLSVSLGDHTLTFGTSNDFFNIGNLFIRKTYGYYEYNLDDFLKVGTPEEVNPTRYDLSYVNDNVKGGPLWYANLKAAQLGFYAQDEWNVNQKLKLTYGLRIDVPIFFDTPSENKAFNNEPTIKKAGYNNAKMPSSMPLFSPRIGFRYNMSDSSNPIILRGGVGVFTGRIPFVWLVNSISRTGIELSDASLRKASDFPATFKFNADVNSQYKPTNGIGTPEVDLAATNFKFPQIFRANLAVDANLFWGMKGTLEGMFSKNINDIKYSNLWYTLDEESNFITEGNLKRPTYKKINKNYSDVILLSNTNKGYSYNVTAQLSKTFGFGLFASVAYTYGHSFILNPGGSSQASSNWKFNYTYYGDSKEDLSYSPFDLGHRVLVNLSYRKEYLKHFATTVSLIYNGQSGSRFSVLVADDINKDGVKGNDLAYLPTNDNINAMSENDAIALKSFIKNNNLSEYQGSYLPRNILRTPFTNNIDLHLAQEFFFNISGKRHTIELSADVINLTNLFDREAGLTYFVKYGNVTPFTYKQNKYGVIASKLNKLWNLSDISSRWHAQIGLKYKF